MTGGEGAECNAVPETPCWRPVYDGSGMQTEGNDGGAGVDRPSSSTMRNEHQSELEGKRSGRRDARCDTRPGGSIESSEGGTARCSARGSALAGSSAS